MADGVLSELQAGRLVTTRWTASDALKMASLLGLPGALLFAFKAFTIPGDDWVQLLDDGEPRCKRREVRNDGDDPIEVEITWGDDERSKKTFSIRPKSSMLFECCVSLIRVRGKGGKGTSTTHEKGTFIVMHGPGQAYYREPDTPKFPDCRTFEIRNSGKKKFKVRYTRDSPGQAPDEMKESDVEPGNTLEIRCKIRSIDIQGDADIEAWVEEINEVV